MKFVWDENKNRANRAKHGIDFKTATLLWNDEHRVEIRTTFSDENRSIMIGRIKAKLWAAIFTQREEATLPLQKLEVSRAKASMVKP